MSHVGQIAGPAVSQGTNVVKDAYMQIKLQYDYVKKLEKNFKRLELEANRLHAEKVDAEEWIKRSKINMEMSNKCKNRLREIEEIEKEVEVLKTKYQNTRKCLWGMWPFPTLRKLGSEVVKKTKEMSSLCENPMKREDIVIPKKLETYDLKLADAEDIVPSLSENVEKLLKYLQDEDVRKIGIWGMPGVGKTTIMSSLNDRVSQMGKFEKVIWVEAEEENTIRKMQQDLVACLHLPVQDTNCKEQIATTISRVLKESKYLLLLDRVSSYINLSEVGIRDNHKHGKVVIATRSKINCERMGMDETINVKRLSNEDAWELFRKIVGKVADHPRIKETAKRILKELGGLPQVIRSVAASLKNEPEFMFTGTLWTLQSRNDSKLQGLDDVYNAFKLLYDQLFDDRKKCLLYRSLFPDDYQIDKDYLMECWKAEQFIPNIHRVGRAHDVRSLRAARDMGYLILRDLTDACLLEWDLRKKCVTMPRIFWTMAQRIPYPQEEGCTSWVCAGVNPVEPPSDEIWVNAKKISLICSKIESLPEKPRCNQLSTLLLQRNKELREIHHSFFDDMPELRVLDLSNTGIISLPSSLFGLNSLNGLYLNSCQDLVMLSTEMGSLKNLEVLDIGGTGICTMPLEIGELGCLRCLRLSFIHRNTVGNQTDQQAGRMIPPNVIEKLCQLEELTIFVDPRDPRWNEIVDEVVVEVASLRRLTTLFFYFPNAVNLANFITSSKSWNDVNTPWGTSSFRSFQFLVGSHEVNRSYGLDSSKGKVERHLRCSTSEEIALPAVREVLKQADAFELIGHEDVQIFSSLGMDCIESLEVCTIKDCNQLVSIVDGNMATGIAFPFLEKLHLINLKTLKCIWQGPFKNNSLANLLILTLSGCPLLSKVLSLTITQQLSQLQQLKVDNCSAVKNVIEAENQSEERVEVQDPTGVLPRLEVLELVNLPSLVQICQSNTLGCRSLGRIKIKGCSLLQNLSVILSNARQLRRIECCKTWWGALNFQDNRTKADLERFCDFIPEESLFANGTQLGHEVVHNQMPNLNGLARHAMENLINQGKGKVIIPADEGTSNG